MKDLENLAESRSFLIMWDKRTALLLAYLKKLKLKITAPTPYYIMAHLA